MKLKSQEAVYRKLGGMAGGLPFTVSRTLSKNEGEYWFIHVGNICVMGDTPEECFKKLALKWRER
jgi:hypothetical protein